MSVMFSRRRTFLLHDNDLGKHTSQFQMNGLAWLAWLAWFCSVEQSSAQGRSPSYEGQMLVFVEAVGVFVLLEQFCQTLQVNLMKTLDVVGAGTRSLDDRDGFPHCRTRRERLAMLTAANVTESPQTHRKKLASIFGLTREAE
ncbi:hypothetical protein AN396_01570 [Candidatus Epulonipiscium fishelsonii]|uniref:Uncharacterized protein n=1 Tax=Candidatus Epulonipiscium fishelsonii TaxID=77094 RepID=A0ACC8X8I5_9FIRM|nr:hypothetical protein AN396_01570 [Epulopiscium sp. SCG-B11WGA-EpuloA1]